MTRSMTPTKDRNTPRGLPLLRTVIVGLVLGLSGPTQLRADITNFDLQGRIYTKWLYQNDDSQGLVTYGNPFWPDNITGTNGVGTEFELKIKGQISKMVRADVRLKSRFGGLWQDWWENGDQGYPIPNTSGESLGMNHGEYIKLRGYRIEANLPIPTLKNVVVGSSELGMFNSWTIGKIRYTDRDNAKGMFLFGGTDNGAFDYVAAAIALPKLFVGPGWSTGLGDPLLANAFWSSDWAYGLKFKVEDLDIGSFTLIGTLTRDHEIDVADPDAKGSTNPLCLDALGNPIRGCQKDHSVERITRYSNAVATLQYKGEPTETLSLDVMAAVSTSDVNEDASFNGVAGNAGVSPIVFADVADLAGVLRVDVLDPFDMGLGFKLELFSIGEHFNSVFGARREADVLLTDGFIEGGQLPTLNIANEFMDFDESFYESAIGWVGATFVPVLELDEVTFTAEFTYLGYHTNTQERDVSGKYPDFLHTDGFTDTDIYDYANSSDRGRDPRSVFRRNQDRHTLIARLEARTEFETDVPLALDIKLKAILDRDARSHSTAEDDYEGQRYVGRLVLESKPLEGLSIALGGQGEFWDEVNRRGTLELGYGNDTTTKAKAFLMATYSWSGFHLRYYLEYLHKEQEREREDNQRWDIVRSKATLEVMW
jgi:hypothetical protein